MLLWPNWPNAGACDVRFGRRWMSFAARCLPECCSSSTGLKVALAERERWDDLYHAICLLAFLTGASGAVWAVPPREGVEANDGIIFLSKLHSTLLNIGLHMMHELYNVAMPLDLWDIKSFSASLLKPAIARFCCDRSRRRTLGGVNKSQPWA